jgi:histone acetyltransferase (RNA polymerase elongator complex component)
VLGVKKLGKSEMNGFNPCGDQAAHFTNQVENLDVTNSACNHEKVGTTFETRPTICEPLVSERKAQARWVVVVGQRMR